MKAILIVTVISCLKIATSAQEATNAQSSAVWKPQALANGFYGLDSKYRSFSGEEIKIDGTNFHYRFFSDVIDDNHDYTGAVVQLKDHILLDHPKVRNPERISGVLSNRPVLWQWESYELWKQRGLQPRPGEVLSLVPTNTVPTNTEPSGPANRSQPVRTQKNQKPTAAGSGR